MHLSTEFDLATKRQLQGLGVKGNFYLPSGKIIKLPEDFLEIQSEKKGSVTFITKRDQLNILDKRLLSSEIFKKRYTVCITSIPSDFRAKSLALIIFENAYKEYLEQKRKNLKAVATKSTPVWITLTDKTKIDETKILNSCFIVVSNLFNEATSGRLQKFRDLLEINNDDKTIITVGGNFNPVELFKKIGFKLNFAFMLN